jgi:phosphatidylglycerol---prolipoprotein diacylglyceryl transferase
VTLSLHPALHPVFETLAYTLGYALYRRTRIRSGDILEDDQRWVVIAAAAIGALLGSRILGLLEQAPRVHLTCRWCCRVARPSLVLCWAAGLPSS